MGEWLIGASMLSPQQARIALFSPKRVICCGITSFGTAIGKSDGGTEMGIGLPLDDGSSARGFQRLSAHDTLDCC
jgi:hypothetical protein